MRIRIRPLVGFGRYAHDLFAVRPGGLVSPFVATTIRRCHELHRDRVGVETVSERRLGAAKILIRKEPQEFGLL